MLDLGQQRGQRGQVVRSGEDREREMKQFGRALHRGLCDAQDALRNRPAHGRAEGLQHVVETQDPQTGKMARLVAMHGACAI